MSLKTGFLKLKIDSASVDLSVHRVQTTSSPRALDYPANSVTHSSCMSYTTDLSLPIKCKEMCLPVTLTGLRHVTDDQKTYKNPSLRAQGQTRSPTKSHTPSPTSPKAHSPQTHAPVLALEGKKWRVVSGALWHWLCFILFRYQGLNLGPSHCAVSLSIFILFQDSLSKLAQAGHQLVGFQALTTMHRAFPGPCRGWRSLYL